MAVPCIDDADWFQACALYKWAHLVQGPKMEEQGSCGKECARPRRGILKNTSVRRSLKRFYSRSTMNESAADLHSVPSVDHEREAPPKPTEGRRYRKVSFSTAVEARHFGDEVIEDEMRSSYYYARDEQVISCLRRSVNQSLQSASSDNRSLLSDDQINKADGHRTAWWRRMWRSFTEKLKHVRYSY